MADTGPQPAAPDVISNRPVLEDTSDNTTTIVIFVCVLFTALVIIAAVAIGMAVFIVKRRRKRRRYLRVNYASQSQSELSHRSDVTALSRYSDIIAHNLCSDLVAHNRNSDISSALNRSTDPVVALDTNIEGTGGAALSAMLDSSNGAVSIKKSSTLEQVYASLECINDHVTELPATRTPIQFQLGSDGADNVDDSHEGYYLDATEELAKYSHDSGLSCTAGFSPPMKHRRTCSRSMPSLSAHAEALNFMLATPPSHRAGAITPSRPKSFTEKFNHFVSGKSNFAAAGVSTNGSGFGGIRIRPRSFNDKLNLAVIRPDVEILSYNARQRSSSGKSSNGSTVINSVSGARDLQVHSSHAASRLARNRRLANSLHSDSGSLSESKKQQNGTTSPFTNFRQGVSMKLSSIRASFSKDGRRQIAAAAATAETTIPGVGVGSEPQTVRVIISDEDSIPTGSDSGVRPLSRPDGTAKEQTVPIQNAEGITRLACPAEYVRSFSDFELPSGLSAMDSLKSELNDVFIAAMDCERCLQNLEECKIDIRSNRSNSRDTHLNCLHGESNGFRKQCDAHYSEKVSKDVRTSSQSCSQLDRAVSRCAGNETEPQKMGIELSLTKKSCSSGRM